MKYITLSFDDGTVQDRRFVALLNQYGLKCTFNLNSGLFSTKHEITHEGIRVCHDEIEAEEVATLYRGHEVAAHTVTHPNLLKCTEQQVIREVREDALALGELVGCKIVGMAYPGGPYFNRETIRIIRENTDIVYARAVGSHFTLEMPKDLMAWYPSVYLHPRELERAYALTDALLAYEGEEDRLLYLWGHSFELDKFALWEETERLFAHMSGHDTVMYVTNREVAGAVGACVNL